MDQPTKNFISRFLEKTSLPKDYSVLEVGSKDVNGEIRSFFKNASIYHGVDIHPGDNVDFVGHLCDPGVLKKMNKDYDLVLCLNVLEHDLLWRNTLVECFNRTRLAGHFLCVVPGEIDVNTLVYKHKLSHFPRGTPPMMTTSNVWFLDESETSYMNYRTESPTEYERMKKLIAQYPRPWDNRSPIGAILNSTVPDSVSKNVQWKSRLKTCHNVHYTPEGEYYGNLALGDIFEIMTYSYNMNRFKVDYELNLYGGLQHCINFKRVQ